MQAIIYLGKIGIVILLMVCFSSMSYGQRRLAKNSHIVRGHCIDVYNEIKDSTKTDSLVIAEFFQYYKFENGVSFRPSQWSQAVVYIKAKENANMFCRLKDADREYDLIDVPRKKPKDIKEE
ncbi:MAG TPA: hypothetical protein PLH91_03225 [Tenuifilaceae bacterium]|nr:hypothetical protein [Tenuifilaceae bacterium]HPI44219.1 hypothetical protein [Tenuifilaceae bacterium]